MSDINIVIISVVAFICSWVVVDLSIDMRDKQILKECSFMEKSKQEVNSECIKLREKIGRI